MQGETRRAGTIPAPTDISWGVPRSVLYLIVFILLIAFWSMVAFAVLG